MHVSIITILESGQHLSYHEEFGTDSIEEVSKVVIADHLAERLNHNLDLKRLVVVAGDLTWSISPDLGQHLLYERRAS